MGNVTVASNTLLVFRQVPSVAVVSTPNASQCLAAGDTLVLTVQVCPAMRAPVEGMALVVVNSFCG
jgi:hypothetical protein